MDKAGIDRQRLAAARVLVVGDAMLDRYWFGAVDRISPEAPVPVVRVTREELRLGGAANVAMNIVKLGAAASLMGVLGSDEAGERLLGLVTAAGIQPLLERDPGLSTIVKLRVIGRSQQLIRLDFDAPPQAAPLARMGAAFGAALAQHAAVVFSDYGKGALAQVAGLIADARAAGKTVLVDPKGSDYSRYAGAHVVTPNLAELAQVVGDWPDEASLHQRAQALRTRLGLQALLLTRADEGMTLFDAEGSLHVSAVAQEVYDVTGAGDTVIAVLACLLGAGVPLREAVPVANRAGGLIVSRFGTAGLSFEELFG